VLGRMCMFCLRCLEPKEDDDYNGILLAVHIHAEMRKRAHICIYVAGHSKRRVIEYTESSECSGYSEGDISCMMKIDIGAIL
jgi:hypothetical protein